jgi:hypothetical protein
MSAMNASPAILLLLTTLLPLRPARANEPAAATAHPDGPATVIHQELLTDLNDPHFRPSLPPPLNRAGIAAHGVFRICLSAAGRVSHVEPVKATDPLVNDRWIKLIRRWQYRPLSINGRPRPSCHIARIYVRPPG